MNSSQITCHNRNGVSLEAGKLVRSQTEGTCAESADGIWGEANKVKEILLLNRETLECLR